MGITTFFGLKIDMLLVRKPTQDPATRGPADSRSGNPSFVPLPIQYLKIAVLQNYPYNPSVFIVSGTDLCDRLFTIEGKYDGRKYHLPDVFFPFPIRIVLYIVGEILYSR